MSARLFSLLVLLVFAEISCKHQEKTVDGNEPTPFTDFHVVGGENVMTAGKASEEETFVQGCIEKSLGNNRKALVQFQECLNMNPKSAAANYEVAGIYDELGSPDRALKYAQAAVTLAPENRWYKLRYANILQENNQHEQALKIFKDLSQEEPRNVDLLFRLAASQNFAGSADDALRTYDKIESIEGISDTLAICRIAIYKTKKDLLGEESALLSLTKAFPDQIGYYERLGEFYSATNQIQKAAEVYKGMTKSFPLMVEPHLKLAQFYKSQGQNENAFLEAEHAFEIPDGKSLTGKIALLKSWYPNSDTSKVLSPTKRKEADSLCRVLRRVHPDQAAPFSISADYLFKDGKLQEARDLYHQSAALGQDEFASWKRLMEINDKLEDNVAQEKDCKEVQELFPTQADPYYYLGKIQYEKKDYKNAIHNLESVLDYMEEDPAKAIEIKIMLVDAYRSSGNDEKADRYAEELIKTDTANFAVIVSYCTSLSERRIKLFKAEQLMLKLVEREPANASYLETLGWIEYQMHDYKLANQYLSKALTITPDDARMNERMGDTQFHLDHKEDALKYWKKAKEKGGTNPSLEKKISTKNLEEND